MSIQANGKPLIHSVAFGTAKEHDKQRMRELFHGDETAIFGDSAYADQAEKRGSRAMGLYYGISDKGARQHPLSPKQKKRNRKHSSIRAKVEHPFRVIKVQFGFCIALSLFKCPKDTTLKSEISAIFYKVIVLILLFISP